MRGIIHIKGRKMIAQQDIRYMRSGDNSCEIIRRGNEGHGIGSISRYMWFARVNKPLSSLLESEINRFMENGRLLIENKEGGYIEFYRPLEGNPYRTGSVLQAERVLVPSLKPIT